MNKNDDFQLDIFLEENQPLFTVMGIFGAISIYLTSLMQDSNQYLQFGIVSSFVLFVIVSVVIFIKAFKRRNNELIPLDFLMFNKANMERLLFIIPFLMLIMTIAQFLVSAYKTASFGLFGISLYILGVPVFFGIINLFRKKSMKINFFILIIILVSSLIGFYYMLKFNLIVFALFFSSLTTGSLIGLMITSLFYIYKKYKATIGKI